MFGFSIHMVLLTNVSIEICASSRNSYESKVIKSCRQCDMQIHNMWIFMWHMDGIEIFAFYLQFQMFTSFSRQKKEKTNLQRDKIYIIWINKCENVCDFQYTCTGTHAITIWIDLVWHVSDSRIRVLFYVYLYGGFILYECECLTFPF